MQLQNSLLYIKRLIHAFARPTAQHFARPLPKAKLSLRCITGSGRLQPVIPRRMGSGLYYRYGHGDGKQREYVSLLRHAPYWGFLIYRCDYHSDDARNAFIEGWSSRVKSYLDEQYDDVDLVGKMQFTVKNDRSFLDNASVHQVQELTPSTEPQATDSSLIQGTSTAFMWMPRRWTSALSGLLARVRTTTHDR
jgi:hypothetical protein